MRLYVARIFPCLFWFNLPRLQPSKCRATVIPVMPVISPGGWHRYMEWGKQILQLNGIRWYTVYIYIIIYIYIPKKILYWQYIYIPKKTIGKCWKNHIHSPPNVATHEIGVNPPTNWGENLGGPFAHHREEVGRSSYSAGEVRVGNKSQIFSHQKSWCAMIKFLELLRKININPSIHGNL